MDGFSGDFFIIFIFLFFLIIFSFVVAIFDPVSDVETMLPRP